MSHDPVFEREQMGPDQVADYLERGVARALSYLTEACKLEPETVERGWCVYKGRGVLRVTTFMLAAGVDGEKVEQGLASYFLDDEKPSPPNRDPRTMSDLPVTRVT